jgi:hypothetical protein
MNLTASLPPGTDDAARGTRAIRPPGKVTALSDLWTAVADVSAN